MKLFFLRLHSVLQTTRTTHSSPALPPQSLYQFNTETVFAQQGDSQALNAGAAAERSPSRTCFLTSSPHFSIFLPPFFVCIERKKHMFPSKGRRVEHKLSLVKGWVLFQGQSEILSEQQRLIRALAKVLLYAEYISRANICIQHINGLGRPLITGQHWCGMQVSP